jgi:hypothetical protein
VAPEGRAVEEVVRTAGAEAALLVRLVVDLRLLDGAVSPVAAVAAPAAVGVLMADVARCRQRSASKTLACSLF